jgi:hypothetical protein
MAHLKWTSLAGAAALVCSFGASAQAIHGFCSDCVDNIIGGSEVLSTGTNPPMNFGFWSGSGLTGAYTIDILTPDNLAAAASYSIHDGASGTATLVSTTPWTSKFLDEYVGINGQPNNPLDAWLPATKTLDSGATGYWVFQADLGTHALGTAAGSAPLLNLGSSLPAGSLIVAFLDAGGNHLSGTANSSAIFEMGTSSGGGGGTGVPEPGTAALLVTALLGFGMRWRRAPRSGAPAA